jgi:cell division protein FtsB
MPVERGASQQVILRHLRTACMTLGLAGLSAFFVWQSIYGESGMLARERRLGEIAEARATLARAEAERVAMERRVAGLRSEVIDRDQLDERARQLLNLVGRDEIVVPYDQGRRLY